jgi:DNA-binding beta-propeller fold protein YncE
MTRGRNAALVTSVAAMLALATGCHSNNNSTPTDGGNPVDGGTPVDAGTPADGGTPDGGTATNTDGGNPSTATASASNPAEDVFALPLDAAPSPDGNTIYFIAANGNGMAVFSTAAATGSMPALLTSGGALGAPLGIAVSSDGTKLYLADPAAQTPNDKGVVFVEAASGGDPSQLSETLDFTPRAIAVSKVGGVDELVFIGTSPTANQDGSFTDGVFKDVSGTVTPVLAGGNPSAIAVATDGTIYILDQAGSIAKVAAGATTATALAGASQTLSVSFPSGMDVSLDQTALLVSGFDPATAKESISRVNIATGAVTQLVFNPAFTGLEPAGLHRAFNSDAFAFVDSGANTSGTIYLLK